MLILIENYIYLWVLILSIAEYEYTLHLIFVYKIEKYFLTLDLKQWCESQTFLIIHIFLDVLSSLLNSQMLAVVWSIWVAKLCV